jgi:parallel beta-helix repeat protein
MLQRLRRRRLTQLALGLPALSAVPRHAAATVYEVGPGATLASPGAVPWGSLQPGDEVVLRPGRYSGIIAIGVRGTAERPVVVRAMPGAVLQDTVLFEGAQHVRLEGLVVEKSRLSGVIIRRGAAFITVQGCTVRNCGLGIWIGDGAGGGHRLLDNQLLDNTTHGVAVDVVNAPAGQETLIANNRVARNAMHGMELNGNRYVVEGNWVWNNGHGLSGTSGIHTYCKDARQDAGRDNVIRYNVVWGQQETRGQDGNGIQLDQWCDRNQVYFNICFGNDGAGIAVFDAADCLVANNTLYDNMRDTGGRHAYKADLVLASDFTKKVDHVLNNVVRNNLVVTRRAGIAGIYVDPFAARNTHEIAGNLFHHAGGESPFVWDRNRLAGLAAWNAVKPGAPDLQGDPLLVNPALLEAATPDLSGLRPRLDSTHKGLPLGALAARDHAGTSFATPPIGALLPAAR